MPDELTIDEEQGGEVFVEPVYGSHRWFEEKKEPEPEYEYTNWEIIKTSIKVIIIAVVIGAVAIAAIKLHIGIVA